MGFKNTIIRINIVALSKEPDKGSYDRHYASTNARQLMTCLYSTFQGFFRSAYKAVYRGCNQI
eukprot:scaffold74911_cov20-Prasinocladus_malaysianus.AAC.1